MFDIHKALIYSQPLFPLQYDRPWGSLRPRIDRERTRKPRLVGGVRGAIKKEYIIRLRLMNLRFPYREAPPCGRGASVPERIYTH